MNKLTLNLEDLHVESFSTTSEPSMHRGTVRAHGYSDDLQCTFNPDFKPESFELGCGGTGDGGEATYRLSCPYCTGPYCGPGDASYDSCYTGNDTGC